MWGRFTSQMGSSTKLSQGSANGVEFLPGFHMLTLCMRAGKCDLDRKMTRPVSPGKRLLTVRSVSTRSQKV